MLSVILISAVTQRVGLWFSDEHVDQRWCPNAKTHSRSPSVSYRSDSFRVCVCCLETSAGCVCCPCTKLKTQQQRAQQLVKLSGVLRKSVSRMPIFFVHTLCPSDALKIDPGTRACDFPVTSRCDPCEGIRFWLHLSQRERLIPLVPRSRGATLPLLQWSRWLTAFFSVLRELFREADLTMPKVKVPGECGPRGRAFSSRATATEECGVFDDF